MNKNGLRMMGLILMIFSVFGILGGTFIKGEMFAAWLAPVLTGVGVLLLVVGVVFYKVLEDGEK